MECVYPSVGPNGRFSREVVWSPDVGAYAVPLPADETAFRASKRCRQIRRTARHIDLDGPVGYRRKSLRDVTDFVQRRALQFHTTHPKKTFRKTCKGSALDKQFSKYKDDVLLSESCMRNTLNTETTLTDVALMDTLFDDYRVQSYSRGLDDNVQGRDNFQQVFEKSLSLAFDSESDSHSDCTTPGQMQKASHTDLVRKSSVVHCGDSNAMPPKRNLKVSRRVMFG